MPNNKVWNLKLEFIYDMKYKISKFNLNIYKSHQEIIEYKITSIEYKEVMPNNQVWNLKLEFIYVMKYKISKFNLNITIEVNSIKEFKYST